MKSRRRLSLVDYLRFTLPGVVTVMLMMILLTVFGWSVVTGSERVRGKCNRAYARARSAADSAQVDRVRLGGRPFNENTCGDMRRRGFLNPPLRPS